MTNSRREGLALCAFSLAAALWLAMFLWSFVEAMIHPSGSPTNDEVRALLGMFGASIVLVFIGVVVMPRRRR